MNCSAVELTEMPRAFSISIQSETVDLRPALPCTAPASEIIFACRASASVSVDLPASGWEMTANVRRRWASARTSLPDPGFGTPVDSLTAEACGVLNAETSRSGTGAAVAGNSSMLLGNS